MNAVGRALLGEESQIARVLVLDKGPNVGGQS